MEEPSFTDVAAGNLERPPLCDKVARSSTSRVAQTLREHIDRLLRKAFVGRQGGEQDDQ